jgi:NAD(P)-dependent dehydrogenase (short-subunit alcohol dehydrogenase family)
MSWTPESLTDLSEKTFVVTGGNSGLGLESMRILAGKRARVVFTARSERNTTTALEDVRRSVPDANVEHVLLDLASLASVE